MAIINTEDTLNATLTSAEYTQLNVEQQMNYWRVNATAEIRGMLLMREHPNWATLCESLTNYINDLGNKTVDEATSQELAILRHSAVSSIDALLKDFTRKDGSVRPALTKYEVIARPFDAPKKLSAMEVKNNELVMKRFESYKKLLALGLNPIDLGYTEDEINDFAERGLV